MTGRDLVRVQVMKDIGNESEAKSMYVIVLELCVAVSVLVLVVKDMSSPATIVFIDTVPVLFAFTKCIEHIPVLLCRVISI